MKGAVAAGHPLTAEAGARILAEGGNAFDACIAAAFVSWCVESPLTGPGAGGFLLAHRPGPPVRDELLDFFVAAPGRGSDKPRGEMVAVDVFFSPTNTQVFHVGAASCAVPGAPAGLAEAHRRYGGLPWKEIVRPAVEVARAGVELNEPQAFVHQILDPVLRFGPESRRIYGESRALRAGDRLPLDDLAETLELLAEEGVEDVYRGDLARRISAHVREQGGLLTEEDLASYAVLERSPVRASFRGHEFVSNPPPSSGGILIAFALGVLDRLDVEAPSGSAEAVAALAAAMAEATDARGGSFVADLHSGGLAGRLLSDGRLDEAARHAASAPRRPAAERPKTPSTTHISVVDADGNAASLSASTGCGSGIVVPGTGIHMNNMLGEEDLNPEGWTAEPGARLTSMMAPSVVVSGGRPRLVVGSAGSIRLRAAIMQIVVNVVQHGMSVEDAVRAPRVHLDGDRLHLEGGFDPGAADRLEEAGFDVVRWDERNLYFGGAAGVALSPEGLEAAGDPRRGGAGIVVA